MIRRSQLLTPIALVATVLAVFCLMNLFSRLISAFGLADLFPDSSALGIAHDIALSSIAFAVGGAIKRARFSLSALFLAVIMEYWSMMNLAKWHGTSVSYEFMHQWPYVITFFSSAMAGWFVGSFISTKLQNRPPKNEA